MLNVDILLPSRCTSVRSGLDRTDVTLFVFSLGFKFYLHKARAVEQQYSLFIYSFAP